MTSAFGKDIKDLTNSELVILAGAGNLEKQAAFKEARRRDMCFSNTPEPRTNAVQQANLTAQSNANQQMNTLAPKFSKGDVVYLRAVVTEVGTCGQIGVAVKQPGDNVVAQFIPAAYEIFRAKHQPKAEIILE